MNGAICLICYESIGWNEDVAVARVLLAPLAQAAQHADIRVGAGSDELVARVGDGGNLAPSVVLGKACRLATRSRGPGPQVPLRVFDTGICRIEVLAIGAIVVNGQREITRNGIILGRRSERGVSTICCATIHPCFGRAVLRHDDGAVATELIPVGRGHNEVELIKGARDISLINLAPCILTSELVVLTGQIFTGIVCTPHVNTAARVVSSRLVVNDEASAAFESLRVAELHLGVFDAGLNDAGWNGVVGRIVGIPVAVAVGEVHLGFRAAGGELHRVVALSVWSVHWLLRWRPLIIGEVAHLHGLPARVSLVVDGKRLVCWQNFLVFLANRRVRRILGLAGRWVVILGCSCVESDRRTCRDGSRNRSILHFNLFGAILSSVHVAIGTVGKVCGVVNLDWLSRIIDGQEAFT